MTKAKLTCPHCGGTEEVEMPKTYCQIFYKCTTCSKLIETIDGFCCVFCSYADVRCLYSARHEEQIKTLRMDIVNLTKA
ncbi:MAG: hypothetical protein ACD_52C00209G0020 [uncultured bacterium]|uniref:Uncharacterized protein n=1 Tax=Candidatus Woesebacteria bacterium RIFCSPHIGHO2_12_FULL_41_24 TaxID=1802510 RepID=A0A1F8AUA6_9BACT|nr:MAG: hypothetical protein ACD_52C00209G0020 [uncultured bacterium]OGM14334.1 MAG: hypothetical protein A2W15_02180 [Candidatus Woesebacteria bacterium RBG_16_41_13]OGM30186.1 MAG: hypothetical protein A2873_03575 [Candidatus Woesebacteria bacterium RIFCSPHIGHO2_01_FULL_42_80]OGM34227.1 MAG: hypothetical protein A3D84_04420 [Candidatus Woesebacteria bacterium RIFCSPHIGHO2_02_FULL_42_20]OGM55316.1 MAG: hypothetical protein A3E44_03475 [Candidatus Woesebacteria bacterium RIFCSPHIGHO2_12_FULL_41